MTGEPARRGVFAVLVVGVVALVCLLLGHRWLQGYLDEQHTKQPKSAPEFSAGGGVSGRVTFADGSPATSIRVDVAWRDSAGRPGSTPSVTDAEGRFHQGNVPVNATTTGVGATLGPLAARADAETLPREGSRGAGVRIVLPAEFRIAGLVRRKGDREPVAGASLEIAGAHATSGAQGEFTIEHVAASALRETRPVVRIVAAGLASLDWHLPKDALPETYGDVTILMESAK
jgi:hypothetical protein